MRGSFHHQTLSSQPLVHSSKLKPLFFTFKNKKLGGGLLKGVWSGPREWQWKAGVKRKNFQARLDISNLRNIQENAQKSEALYPIPLNVSHETQMKWKNYRKLQSDLLPWSSFNKEQETLKAWSYVFGNEEVDSKVVVVGGLPVRVSDAKKAAIGPIKTFFQSISERIAASPEKQLLLDLQHICSHPEDSLEKAKKVSEDFENWKTLLQPQDTDLVLLMSRMAAVHHPDFYSVSQKESDQLLTSYLNDCQSTEQLGTLFQMLRVKRAYRLSPSTEFLDRLALKTFLIESKISQSKENASTEMPAVPLVLQETNKRIQPRDYPFKRGPKFYFYPKTPEDSSPRVPFLLKPEPALDTNLTIPQFPNNHRIHRLLPDDKIKYLSIKLEHQMKMEKWHQESNEHKNLEPLRHYAELFRFHLPSLQFYGQGNKDLSLLTELTMMKCLMTQNSDIASGLFQDFKNNTTPKPAFNQSSLGLLLTSLSMSNMLTEEQYNTIQKDYGKQRPCKSYFGFDFLIPMVQSNLYISSSQPKALGCLQMAFEECRQYQSDNSDILEARDQVIKSLNPFINQLLEKIEDSNQKVEYQKQWNAISKHQASLLNH